MPHNLLLSRCLNNSSPLTSDEVEVYARNHHCLVRGLVYQAKTNQQGGVIYPKDSLEQFISKYKQRPELVEQDCCESITQIIENNIDKFYVFSIEPKTQLPSLIKDHYDLYALLQENK